MRVRRPATYIMTNERNGTLYIGVTSDLVQRVWQHKTGTYEGFTARYACDLMVQYELHDTMIVAISREKQLKGGSRGKKLALIEQSNPQWLDLYAAIV